MPSTMRFRSQRRSGRLELQVNESLLQHVIDLMAKLEARTQAAPPRLYGILGLRGMLKAVEEEESPEHQAARLAALQADLEAALQALEIGRASCRERVCQYVYISVVAVYFKKKYKND